MIASVHGLREMVEDAFPQLWPPTEAALATILAMVPDDVVNPPTLIFTGPASGGKTTVLDLVSPEKGEAETITYRCDQFTPKAFVSHSANVKRADLEKIDLLPRIRHRALVTPELAPVFRGKEDALVDRFVILTAVLDGHGFTSDSGTQGRRGYTGDYLFAWLGATTPLPTFAWRVMAQLGSRLSFYMMPNQTVTDAELDEVLTGQPYRDRLAACRQTVGAVLNEQLGRWGGVRGLRWDRRKNPETVLQQLKGLARLVAASRGIVSVWQDREGDLAFTPPNVEAPHRALACLYNLARGRALLWGRTTLTLEDLHLIRHVALSSAPHERALLVRGLIETGGELTTRQAAEALDATPTTARKAMTALHVLKIATLEGEGDHGEGTRLVIRPEWRGCVGLDLRETHTAPPGFQPMAELGGEVESGKDVCVSSPDGDLDPWQEP